MVDLRQMRKTVRDKTKEMKKDYSCVSYIMNGIEEPRCMKIEVPKQYEFGHVLRSSVVLK